MRIRFLADENFNRRILTGLLRRVASLDIERVQDIGLRKADDPTVLDWAAERNRVLLTHDVATIPDFAFARKSRGDVKPGVIVVPAKLAIGEAIADLALIAQAIVDRVTFNAHIIETGTESYRLRSTRQRRTGGAKSNEHTEANPG